MTLAVNILEKNLEMGKGTSKSFCFIKVLASSAFQHYISISVEGLVNKFLEKSFMQKNAAFVDIRTHDFDYCDNFGP